MTKRLFGEFMLGLALLLAQAATSESYIVTQLNSQGEPAGVTCNYSEGGSEIRKGFVVIETSGTIDGTTFPSIEEMRCGGGFRDSGDFPDAYFPIDDLSTNQFVGVNGMAFPSLEEQRNR